MRGFFYREGRGAKLLIFYDSLLAVFVRSLLRSVHICLFVRSFVCSSFVCSRPTTNNQRATKHKQTNEPNKQTNRIYIFMCPEVGLEFAFLGVRRSD